MKKVFFTLTILSFIFVVNPVQAVSVPTGEACTSHLECALSDYCSPPEPNRVCKNDLADGASPCFSDEMCLSNNCNLETTNCEPTTSTTTGTTTTETPDVISEDETRSVSTRLPNPLGTDSIQVIMGRVIRYIIGISGTVALAVLVYGGVMLLMSGGREGAVKKGKNAVIYSVLGLIIIFSSYVIVKFIIAALSQS